MAGEKQNQDCYSQGAPHLPNIEARRATGKEIATCLLEIQALLSLLLTTVIV